MERRICFPSELARVKPTCHQAMDSSVSPSPGVSQVPVPPEVLQSVQALYNRGLCRQAYDRAIQFGPLRQWTGTQARILAGRLAMNLGAPRLGRGQYFAAWHGAPDVVEAQAYAAAAVLDRYGCYAAWRFLQRIELPRIEGS